MGGGGRPFVMDAAAWRHQQHPTNKPGRRDLYPNLDASQKEGRFAVRLCLTHGLQETLSVPLRQSILDFIYTLTISVLCIHNLVRIQ